MLSQRDAGVTTERTSKKEPLSLAEVQELLASVETVAIAKGKVITTKPATETGPDELLGPTGNFRAPLLRIGSTLLVGFHEETLRSLL